MPTGHRRSTRAVLSNGGLLLASVALSLCLAELGVRTFEAFEVRSEHGSLHAELLEAARAAGVAADGYNVYYLGGSTMLGVPYAPRMSLPQIVEQVLGGRVAGRALHSVNLGRSGRDLLYALQRLEHVLSHRNVFHPSLIVLYSGHNEFLDFGFKPPPYAFLEPAWYSISRRSHLFRLLRIRFAAPYRLEIDERRRLDVAPFSPETREEVIRAYRARLARVVARAQEAGLPLIISTAASNLADWAPNRSVLCEGVDAERFVALLDSASTAEAAGDEIGAIERAREARALCPHFAELEYRLGRALERQGDRAGAAEAYWRAVDADAFPIRAGTDINQAIRALADEPGVRVIDAVAVLGSLSQRAAPGYELFIDAHHPRVQGYLSIGRAIAAAMLDLAGEPDRVLARLEPAKAEVLFGLDDPYFRIEQSLNTGRWYVRLATMRYEPAERLDLAERWYESAHSLAPERVDVHLGLAMVAYLRHDTPAAEAHRRDAEAADPEAARRYLAQRWVRDVVRRGGGVPPIRSGDEGDRHVRR